MVLTANENVSDVRDWKAKIFLDNSSEKGFKKGDFQGVGYIGVSYTSNEIIPIPRSDEHQSGYELIEEFHYKKYISNENFITIFALGNNYVQPRDLDNALIAYQKFLDYGGNNNLEVNLDPYSHDKKTYKTISDFLNDNGSETETKGELNPKGKELIATLEKFARQYSNLVNKKRLSDDDKLNYIMDIYIFFENLLKDKDTSKLNGIGFHQSVLKTYLETLNDAQKEKNLVQAASTIFTYYGFKNKIHNILKYIIIKNEKSKKIINNYQEYFGDLNLAYNEFVRIGNI